MEENKQNDLDVERKIGASPNAYFIGYKWVWRSDFWIAWFEMKYKKEKYSTLYWYRPSCPDIFPLHKTLHNQINDCKQLTQCNVGHFMGLITIIMMATGILMITIVIKLKKWLSPRRVLTDLRFGQTHLLVAVWKISTYIYTLPRVYIMSCFKRKYELHKASQSQVWVPNIQMRAPKQTLGIYI